MERATSRIGKYIPRAHPVSWTMLVVTTAAVLIIAIDRVLRPTVLPAILDEFSLSPSASGVLIGLSYLGSLLGGLLLGVFGDSMGKGSQRAWSWLVAVAVTVVSAVLTAFTRTLGLLQALRVTMGMGTGGMEPVNVAMVGEWWQKEDRGFAVGAHHTGFPFGQFLGPVLIGAVIAAATWRQAFLFIPLLAVPIVILQIVFARRSNLRKVNNWIREYRMTPSVEIGELDQQVGSPRLASAARSVRLARGGFLVCAREGRCACACRW